MTTKDDDTRDPHTRAQAAYHDRRKAAGLVRLSVYVPDEDRDEFWTAVEHLRRKWRKRGYPV